MANGVTSYGSEDNKDIPESGGQFSIVYWGVGLALLCGLPFLLTVVFGLDFGNYGHLHKVFIDGQISTPNIDEYFYRLSGAFTHALLEWSAFFAALFTAILAFSHYRITNDITTPVIGIALISSGCMDAFHTLAAARLIEAVADNTNLIPFTWAVCRIFNALIMIAGVGLFIFSMEKEREKKAGMKLVLGVSVIFGVIGYLIIHYCATSASLPQTQFPNALITRPYDVIPLVLFVFAGVYIYPKFLKKHPSTFAYALLLSAIPEVIVELHMAFGSTRLFDNHFNIAHALKVVAYVVPFIGLNLDYVRTYKKEQDSYKRVAEASSALEEQQIELTKLNARLMLSNKELEKFAYIASHDLQEPLRKVQAFGDRLSTKYAKELGDQGVDYLNRMKAASARMRQLIDDLLNFSRVGTQGKAFSHVNLKDVVDIVVSDLQIRIEETGAKVIYKNLPITVNKICSNALVNYIQGIIIMY